MRYRFPLGENCFLDLRSAFGELHKVFGEDVVFEPEFDCKALLVFFDGIRFRVYESGKVMIWKLKLDKFNEIDKILDCFWVDYLSDFVKNRKVIESV
jgi:hypothetical protein